MIEIDGIQWSKKAIKKALEEYINNKNRATEKIMVFRIS